MSLSRRGFLIGLALQVAVVGSLSLLAYVGGLPRWRFLNQYDYVLHAVLVGPIALWLDGIFAYRDVSRRVPVPLGPAIIAAFAVTEEYLQRYSPLRTSTWKDFFGNLIGIVVFTVLGRALFHRRAQ